jgi:putative transposase
MLVMGERAEALVYMGVHFSTGTPLLIVIEDAAPATIGAVSITHHGGVSVSRHFWEIEPPRNRKLPPAVYATPGQPCFFTVRASPGRAPFADEALAQIAVDCLLAQRHKSRCQLDVYCVMPDHVHLVVTPMVAGASSLSYVDRFKGWSSRRLRLAGLEGELWQRRNYDHVLRREEHLERVAAYILANPVRKGLCAEPADYPWSGIPTPLELDTISHILLPGDDERH